MSARLEVKGKGAIITGAGSGINLAFAQELYNAGCSVVIVDIALHKKAVQWIDSLPESGGPRVYFYKADASDWGQLEASFDVYDREVGGVPYIVCPGAGLYEPSHNGFWSNKDVDGHFRLLDINLLSPIKMSRIAIRRMLNANQPGVILHVSSTGAQKASVITPLYQASKAAVSSFVRCMAQLHGMGGIRVVGVAPGIVRSPLYTDHPEVMRYIDPRKDCMLEPEDVGRAMFAAATDLRYQPGTILEVADINDNWREVNILNDPGPRGAASWTSNKNLALADVQRVIDSEKGTSSNGAA